MVDGSSLAGSNTPVAMSDVGSLDMDAEGPPVAMSDVGSLDMDAEGPYYNMYGDINKFHV